MNSQVQSRTNHIYIGPTVPQVGLKQWTLYLESEPPEFLKEQMAKVPLLRALYISTEKLGAARKNLRINPNSMENLAYKALKEIVSKTSQ
jgi:hypothetical protein